MHIARAPPSRQAIQKRAEGNGFSLRIERDYHAFEPRQAGSRHQRLAYRPVRARSAFGHAQRRQQQQEILVVAAGRDEGGTRTLPDIGRAASPVGPGAHGALHAAQARYARKAQ